MTSLSSVVPVSGTRKWRDSASTHATADDVRFRDEMRVRHVSFVDAFVADDGKPYVVYEIRVETKTESWSVFRRYSQLRSFHKSVQRSYKLPSFPKKTFSSNLAQSLIQERMQVLERYLRLVVQQQPESLLFSPIFLELLDVNRHDVISVCAKVARYLHEKGQQILQSNSLFHLTPTQCRCIRRRFNLPLTATVSPLRMTEPAERYGDERDLPFLFEFVHQLRRLKVCPQLSRIPKDQDKGYKMDDIKFDVGKFNHVEELMLEYCNAGALTGLSEIHKNLTLLKVRKCGVKAMSGFLLAKVAVKRRKDGQRVNSWRGDFHTKFLAMDHKIQPWSSLIQLDFSFNDVTSIDPACLAACPLLEKLVLDANSIESINPWLFKGIVMPHLKLLRLNFNDINCLHAPHDHQTFSLQSSRGQSSTSSGHLADKLNVSLGWSDRSSVKRTPNPSNTKPPDYDSPHLFTTDVQDRDLARLQQERTLRLRRQEVQLNSDAQTRFSERLASVTSNDMRTMTSPTSTISGRSAFNNSPFSISSAQNHLGISPAVLAGSPASFASNNGEGSNYLGLPMNDHVEAEPVLPRAEDVHVKRGDDEDNYMGLPMNNHVEAEPVLIPQAENDETQQGDDDESPDPTSPSDESTSCPRPRIASPIFTQDFEDTEEKLYSHSLLRTITYEGNVDDIMTTTTNDLNNVEAKDEIEVDIEQALGLRADSPDFHHKITGKLEIMPLEKEISPPRAVLKPRSQTLPISATSTGQTTPTLDENRTSTLPSRPGKSRFTMEDLKKLADLSTQTSTSPMQAHLMWERRESLLKQDIDSNSDDVQGDDDDYDDDDDEGSATDFISALTNNQMKTSSPVMPDHITEDQAHVDGIADGAVDDYEENHYDNEGDDDDTQLGNVDDIDSSGDLKDTQLNHSSSIPEPSEPLNRSVSQMSNISTMIPLQPPKRLCEVAPNLVELHICKNLLRSVKGIEHLNHLEYLDLRGNLICSLDDLEPIRHLPRLKQLLLAGNPFTKFSDYRQRIWHIFPDFRTSLIIDGEEPH